MTAKWKWGTVFIHGVNDEEVLREVKRAELFPLDSVVSHFHYFGAGSRKYHVKGMIIGTTDRNSIESDAINNVTQDFTTPWETIVDCVINGTPKFTAHKYAGGTIDGVTYTVDLVPIYDCDLEIIA